MDNKGSNKNSNNDKNGITILIFVLAALMVLFVVSLISNSISKMTNKEISYSEFKAMVEKGDVDRVEFSSGRILIYPEVGEGNTPLVNYNTVELNDDELLPFLEKNDVDVKGIPASTTTAIIYNILSIAIPLVILWIAMGFIMRRMGGGGGVMGVGKSNAKVYVEKQTGVTFKDVAGQGEAKESLQEVVDFLHNPRKYTEIGAKLPKGALLVGPPGTGKTLLAKAVAGEAKVPFFSLAGSDFVEMFVGVGASRVRDLFKEAQKHAPCIIFIDEIDAIGKSRDSRLGGNDEREQTLNQLLAEMDGFDTSKGILILAATNRPEVLDKALLRPGRFDRRIIVDKPDLKGRKDTLNVHSKNVLMDESVDLDEIALATSGAVGSDLANMINEAAINAVKNGRRHVNQADLFESVEVVVAGKEKKDRIMGPKEKRMVAYHEVGHALVTALQKDAEPVQKITIVPRTMGALGYTMQVPEEEKFLMTKNELITHLITYMGGRAAEEIVFESVTTGASNDIEQATKIARAMVTQYGMSEKFGLMGLVTVESQYLDGRASLNCGEETAAQIDKEVMKILQESYAKAKALLEENRDALDEISEQLYQNETITGKEFMKIFRKLNGIPEPTEDEKEKESHIKKKAKPEWKVGKPDKPKELPPNLSKGQMGSKPVAAEAAKNLNFVPMNPETDAEKAMLEKNLQPKELRYKPMPEFKPSIEVRDISESSPITPPDSEVTDSESSVKSQLSEQIEPSMDVVQNVVLTPAEKLDDSFIVDTLGEPTLIETLDSFTPQEDKAESSKKMPEKVLPQKNLEKPPVKLMLKKESEKPPVKLMSKKEPEKPPVKLMPKKESEKPPVKLMPKKEPVKLMPKKESEKPPVKLMENKEPEKPPMKLMENKEPEKPPVKLKANKEPKKAMEKVKPKKESDRPQRVFVKENSEKVKLLEKENSRKEGTDRFKLDSEMKKPLSAIEMLRNLKDPAAEEDMRSE
jgi:cell division protease FtsH